MKTFYLIAIIHCFTFSSCKKLLQYHPAEVRPDVLQLNNQNINKLEKISQTDSFSFLVISDLQRFYDELEDFVDYENTVDDFSFILITGDITDFGLNKEFNLIAGILQKLKAPFITVIGNHDMLGNGILIYREMFGEENFTFTFGNNKFILFNSNGREVGFNGQLPDMQWLKKAADAEEYTNLFFVSHVPPFSGDFDPNLENEYVTLMNTTPNARLSLHGHEHRFYFGSHYSDNFPYLITPEIQNKSFSRIKVEGTRIFVTQENF